jgi:transcriptional regulator
MYQPPHHREDRLEVQQALIRAHPLGTLITFGAGRLEANFIPFLLDATCGPNGLLQGHLARANGQWRDYDPRIEALVVFQGPESYITPSWYATKAETGKVVPTWNYAVVQARGPLRVIDDRDWLRAQVEALTRSQEARRDHPWAVGDAPEAFVEAQIKGIVGLEIPIAHIEGKWKVSQNRPEADRLGVVDGLAASGDATSGAMAELVRSTREPRR